MDLEPIDPQTAVELYLTDRDGELRSSTLKTYRAQLQFLVEWCEIEDLTNLNELNGRRVQEFRLWRRRNHDINRVTERTQMKALRVFVKWLASIDGVATDLYDQVRVPTIHGGQSRGAVVDSEMAEQMLAYLERYEYASRDHVIIQLLWHTMVRAGGLRSVDLEDYDPAEQYLALVNRGGTDTPLKNGLGGQRLVGLNDDVCMLLDDYIAHRREDIVDEYDREPLITTSRGRVSVNTIRSTCYKWTRPCKVGLGCPHGRDPDECRAARRIDDASKCPSSEGSHAFRRGGITHHLSNDIPQEIVSDRADVSPDVLEKHYDERSAKQRMEQRREYLNNI